MKVWVEGFLENPERFEVVASRYTGSQLITEVGLPLDGTIVEVDQKTLNYSTQRLSRYASQSDHSLEALVLRMDVMIDGMKLIKDVTIDLVGIRSYNLELEDDRRDLGSNFGFVVRTQNRANGKITQGK